MKKEFHSHSDCLNFDPQKRAELAAEGSKRAATFIKDVVAGKKVKNRRWGFDNKLITEVNKKILFYAPNGVRGKLRDVHDDNTEVDTELVVRGIELPTKYYKFGRWLESRVEDLYQRDDILEALRIACEFHYGLTGPQLHPFLDGNGRTARIITNGILMLRAKESTLGIPILPVPQLRNYFPTRGRVDPYIQALRSTHKNQLLNPLEKYIASVWASNLDNRINRIEDNIRKLNKTDQDLVDRFKTRRDVLRTYVDCEECDNIPPHYIPDYFAPIGVFR